MIDKMSFPVVEPDPSKGSQEFQKFKEKLDPLILAWARAFISKDIRLQTGLLRKISSLLPTPVTSKDLLVMCEALRDEGEPGFADFARPQIAQPSVVKSDDKMVFKNKVYAIEKETKTPQFLIEFYGISPKLIARVEKDVIEKENEHEKELGYQKHTHEQLVLNKLLALVFEKIESMFASFRFSGISVDSKSVFWVHDLVDKLLNRNEDRKHEQDLPPVSIKIAKPPATRGATYLRNFNSEYRRKALMEEIQKLNNFGIESQMRMISKKNKGKTVSFGQIEPMERAVDDLTTKSFGRDAIGSDVYEQMYYKSHARGGNSKPKRKEKRA